MPDKKKRNAEWTQNRTPPKSQINTPEKPIVESVAKEAGQDSMTAQQRTIHQRSRL